MPVIVRQSQPYLAQGKQAEAILQKIEKASTVFDQPMHSPSILDVRVKTEEPDVPVAPNSPFINQPDGLSQESPNQPTNQLEHWGPKDDPNPFDATPDSTLNSPPPSDWSQDWKVDGFPPQSIDPDLEMAPEPTLYGEPSDWPNDWDADEFSAEAFESHAEFAPTPTLYGETSDAPNNWEPEEYFPMRE